METVDALVAATNDGNVRKIAVKGRLANAPSIRLSPGQSLAGAGAEAGVTFAAGTDGLQLSCDNRICNICLDTSPGGRLMVKQLITGAIHTDGGIAVHTPGKITGGVFTSYGTHVDVVINRGPIVTHGPNDMVLDNRGVVDRWTAEEKLTSHGPSGIGFVNFGTVNELKINAPIETFGEGARGFNVYDGTVKLAVFDRVTTHAGARSAFNSPSRSAGSSCIGALRPSAAKANRWSRENTVKLTAVALSIKPGGSARRSRSPAVSRPTPRDLSDRAAARSNRSESRRLRCGRRALRLVRGSDGIRTAFHLARDTKPPGIST